MGMKPQKPCARKEKQRSVSDKTPRESQRSPSTFEEIAGELKNAGWGRDRLTQEIEAAFCNIGVSFIKLKPYFELLQKADELFADASEIMKWQTLDGFIAHSLFCRARGCFFGAVRLSCSGQLTETWILLRASIENCLYGFYIFGCPERAGIWVNRHNNESSKRKCRKTFAVANIWNELKAKSATTAREARRFYNKAIDWGGHPNERSLFPNVTPKQDGSGYAFRFVNPDPALMRATIIATIICASLTFAISAMVFPDVFGQPNIQVKTQNLKRQSVPLMAQMTEQLKQSVCCSL
jgi:hypothetical protein